MWTKSRGRSKVAAQVALVVAMGLLLSGCGALSLFKSHEDEPGANEPYPNLSSVPDRPEEKESAADRRKIAEGLVADRTQVQYTDQTLRGGTEASAPPPPPPVAEMPDTTSADSTGATQASKDETEEERPGFFGRLFGSKESEESNAASAEPSAEQATAPASTEAAPAPSTAEAQPAAETPQATPAESTGATEISKDQSAESKRGFFHRIFGSEKSKANENDAASSSAEPTPSAAEAQPAAEASPTAAPGESTGATELRKDQSEESKPGFFHRLFGSKKNKETTDPSHDAQPALPDPAAAPSASPAAAQ